MEVAKDDVHPIQQTLQTYSVMQHGLVGRNCTTLGVRNLDLKPLDTYLWWRVDSVFSIFCLARIFFHYYSHVGGGNISDTKSLECPDVVPPWPAWGLTFLCSLKNLRSNRESTGDKRGHAKLGEKMKVYKVELVTKWLSCDWSVLETSNTLTGNFITTSWVSAFLLFCLELVKNFSWERKMFGPLK